MKKVKQNEGLGKEAFKRLEEMHPHEVLIYVSMIGSGVIFFFTIIAFTLSKPPEAEFFKFELPKSFIISSLVILISSYTVSKILPAYRADQLEGVKKWLGLTLLLGLVFGVLQFTGWKELQANNILFQGQRSGAYLYVISGLHILHLLGVMVFVLYLLLEAQKTSKDVVKHLIYSTNPYQKVKFSILERTWHFIDAAWICIFFYFVLTF